MFIKKIIITLIGTLSLIFYSCSDDPASTGKEILKQDFVNVHVIDSFTDSIPQSSSYFKRSIKLGSAETNLIGKNKNVEASTLMRFFISFPDSIKEAFKENNLNIVSSTVELYETYTFGDDLASYDFTVHEINNGWTFQNFIADSLSRLSYNQTDVSFDKTFTDTLNTFNIENTLVKQWFQLFVDSSKSDNFGIYIKPAPGTQKVVGYQALSLISGNLPILKVIVEKPGSFTDTLSFLAASDVSVVTGDLPSINSENISVQGGLIVNSKIKFDVSRIPQDAIINNAALTLYLDTLETIIGKNFPNSLTALIISNESKNIADSSFAITMSRSGNSYTCDISFYAQKWVRSANYGLLIRTTNEKSTVNLFSIKGSAASDFSLRPRLKITYLSRN